MMNYVVESAKSVVAVIDGKRCDSFDYVEMRRADNNKLIDKICAGDVALLNGLRRSDQESVSIDALRLCNPLVHQLAFVEAIYRECDEENAKHPQRDLMIRVMHIKSRVIDNDEPQFYILNVLVNDRADVLVKRCEQHVNEHDNALFIAMPNPSGTPHTMVVTHVMKSNGKCKKLENFRGIFTTANSQRAQQTLTKKRPFKKVAFVIESDDESDASDKWAKHAYDGTSRENAHELAKIQSEMDRQSLEFEMNEARVREEESALEAAAKAVATEQQREMEAMRADIEAESLKRMLFAERDAHEADRAYILNALKDIEVPDIPDPIELLDQEFGLPFPDRLRILVFHWMANGIAAIDVYQKLIQSAPDVYKELSNRVAKSRHAPLFHQMHAVWRKCLRLTPITKEGRVVAFGEDAVLFLLYVAAKITHEDESFKRDGCIAAGAPLVLPEAEKI